LLNLSKALSQAMGIDAHGFTIIDVSIGNNVHNLSPQNTKCQHSIVVGWDLTCDKSGHLKHKTLPSPAPIKIRTTKSQYNLSILRRCSEGDSDLRTAVTVPFQGQLTTWL
jgi:hypothetical protein